MKQNKKGFTLIELLAVIVILAIIALIAVPVVMNIINRARQSASADSAYAILKSAEFYYTDLLLTNATEASQGHVFNFKTPESGQLSGSKLEFKGTKPTEGVVTLDANGTAHIGLWNEDTERYEGSLTINGFECTFADANNDVVTCE